MNLDFLRKIRRNHALEHATITIAHSKLNEAGVLGGNSTQWGFFVYGDVPTEVLSQAGRHRRSRGHCRRKAHRQPGSEALHHQWGRGPAEH